MPPCLFLKTQRFGDWIQSPSSGKNLLNWTQSIELVPISGPLCQLQDWVYKPNTEQTICENQENIKLLKLHTYEALHQRSIMIEIILERSNIPFGTNTRKTNFPTQTKFDRVAVS
jgi:hypothetical protein